MKELLTTAEQSKRLKELGIQKVFLIKEKYVGYGQMDTQ